MKTSPTTNQLTIALLEVQKELPKISHDAYNDYFKAHFSTLGAIWDGIREIIHENKIVINQGVTYDSAVAQEGYRGTLFTRLTHVSGEWQQDDGVPLLIETNKAGKENPQSMGSAISYSRRQGLCAMLGIITEDDDGSAASPGNDPKAKTDAKKKPETKKITGPIKTMTALKKACKDLTTDIEQSKDENALAELMGAKGTKALIKQLETDLPNAYDKAHNKKTGFMGIKQHAKKRETELIMEQAQ
tara:strand:+ start:788 stop:1522 length:735 start_codon:yes stop_codon:yes gene_type:complete